MGRVRARHLAVLSVSTAFAAILALDTAGAGGFAVREQSAEGQGSSFAGVAAGGTPSAMFWNPATMTQVPGRTLEVDAAIILPKASQTGASAITTPALGSFGFTAGLENTGSPALVPSSYTTWQLSDRAWFGISVNSPFGLSVNFSNPNWAGAAYGQSTSLATYNVAPTVAFKMTDWLSVGFGLQVQYGQANLANFDGVTGFGTARLLTINGNGWGWGWTAGATLTPTPTTKIGVGYRSQIDQEIEGTQFGGGTPGAVRTTLKLPDMISVGLKQGLGSGWTLLGTFEWTNWSRIGTSTVSQASGAAALSTSGAAIALPFQYSDGYFYSVGAEYALSPAWTVRAGFGYEQSPITDLVRTPRLPDNDRYWYSVGATNWISSRLSADLAYSFIDVKDAPMNLSPGSGNPFYNGAVTYTGTAVSHIHIISLGVKYRWDDPPKSALLTK
jgi:long-chain fatty acid transport protein